MMGSRRHFLKSTVALTGTDALAQSAPPLPRVKFGQHEITRLIVGSNPFYGYSHFNRSLDQHMREWYTPERRMSVLHHCERAGIGTWQFHYSEETIADLKRFRAEGGKLQPILISDYKLTLDAKTLPEVAKLGVLGVAHHGNRTDDQFRKGEKNKVREYLKLVRDAGVMVGISTHDPKVIETAESEGWDVDYYQACLYRITRTAEESRAEFGEAPMGESFMEKDPERMCKVVRQTKKPCLVFKLLAAGRSTNTSQHVERAFRFAFANIKPTDAAIVGMYPRFKDEIAENTALVRQILA